MTATGMSVGTCAYMAPEVLRDEPYSAQADQYALAVTVYEAITGERPYAGSSPFALYDAFQKGHRTLADLSFQIPAAASQVVDQALAGEPEKRFATCEDFAHAFLSGLTTTSVSPTDTEEKQTGETEDATRELNVREYKQALRQKKDGRAGLDFRKPEGTDSSSSQISNVQQSASNNKSMFLIAVAGLVAFVMFGLIGVTLYGTGVIGGNDDSANANDNTSLGLPVASSAASPSSSSEPTVPASFERAQNLFNGTGGELKEKFRAVSMLKELARDGSMQSQKRLGEIYSQAELGSPDFDEAFKWFMLAAEQGDAESQMAVGASYSTGERGAKRDLSEAIRWLQKSADQNFGPAQMMLGVHYFRGLGVDQDNQQAKQWLQKARTAGVVEAETILAQITAASTPYLRSKGTSKISPEGLVYASMKGGNRSDQVLRHQQDDPARPSHGVFDAEGDDIFRLIDEAYSLIKDKDLSVTKQSRGGKDEYQIQFARRIGFQGGRRGQSNGHPSLDSLKLVLEDNRVVTAYPSPSALGEAGKSPSSD